MKGESNWQQWDLTKFSCEDGEDYFNIKILAYLIKWTSDVAVLLSVQLELRSGEFQADLAWR